MSTLQQYRAHGKKGHSFTPFIQVDGIFAKVECVNPSGSIKDRIAKYIVDESERRGLLRPGMRIVEATSGNTGIALARYGRSKGYDVTIVMPEDMTEERKAMIRAFGANLILCSKEGSFAEAVEIRDRLAEDPSCFNPDQFSNALNVECHIKTTGREILEQMPAGLRIDAFAAGVGTGGSLVGVGRALLGEFPEVVVAAVEPEESAVMSGLPAGKHQIYGIGDGFVPALAGNDSGGLHEVIREVIRVSSDEACDAAAGLRERHGLCVGISSGANFLAAQRLRERFETVVTLLPDGWSKYGAQGLCAATDPPCPFKELCPF